MNWHDDYLAREKFLRAEDAVFDQVPQWRQHFFNDYACLLYTSACGSR